MTTSTATPPAAATPVSTKPTVSRELPRGLVVGLVLAPTLLILLVMSGVLGGVLGTGAPLFRFPALLTANTPTGGDMGAHVLLPQILRDELLPSGRLFGWSNDWYAGFPALYFYFPLPALVTVLLDVFLPYGVAFKLVTIAGLVALPAASYVFVRCLGFSRIVSAVAAVAGGMFVFMESYSIFGANIKSTLAGEYSFSWSFALSILYLGILARDVRAGRGFRPAAGVLLALAALAHVVTTLVVVVVSVPLLLRRRGSRPVLGSWALGFGLAAFWAVPLVVRVLQGMTTDMGWSPVRNVVGDAIPGSPLPGELVPLLALATVGVVWTLLRRDDVVALLGLTAMPLLGYFLLPMAGVTILYNARLLPYWYYGVYLFAGIALGLAVTVVARRFPRRGVAATTGAVVAALLLLNATAVGIHDVPGWVVWNYEGYEGKAAWPEYEALMETVDRLPPGRVMWEANSEMNKYGTPMALMLLPYWSPGHPSMEGLFFESSLTTPFHFLNAAEVSERPSNPVRGLRYRGLDFARAVPHLRLYDVAYYISYTDRATEAARSAGLEEIGSAPPWTIFALPHDGPVTVATSRPAVWAGDEDFVSAALEWYDDVDHLDRWLVADGPAAWPRVSTVDERLEDPAPYPPLPSAVSNVVVEDHRIAFDTTAVGVPHLVAVSYFPNWQAVGAEGPYRAAPSLMVVVPTQRHVELQFGNTNAEDIGMVVTVATLAALLLLAVLRRRREGRR